MAGTLPNVPGVRIPYHTDGSLVKVVATNGSTSFSPTAAWTSLSNSTVAEINDGDGAGYLLGSWPAFSIGTGAIISIAFPQPITLTGHNLLHTIGGNGLKATALFLYYSTNTTDGTDGTWTNITSDSSSGTSPLDYRSITPLNITSVVGIRVGAHSTADSTTGGSSTIRELQLYGQWIPTSLAAWHPTLDQQITGYELDFGDVLLGNIYTKEFRIKNGRNLNANDIVVSCTTGTAELINGLTFSLDGSTFMPTVTIPTILSGAISQTVYVRRTVSAGQSPNILSMAPIDFIASSWT